MRIILSPFPISPRFWPVFFRRDATSLLLQAHLCTAVDSMRAVNPVFESVHQESVKVCTTGKVNVHNFTCPSSHSFRLERLNDWCSKNYRKYRPRNRTYAALKWKKSYRIYDERSNEYNDPEMDQSSAEMVF